MKSLLHRLRASLGFVASMAVAFAVSDVVMRHMAGGASQSTELAANSDGAAAAVAATAVRRAAENVTWSQLQLDYVNGMEKYCAANNLSDAAVGMGSPAADGSIRVAVYMHGLGRNPMPVRLWKILVEQVTVCTRRHLPLSVAQCCHLTDRLSCVCFG
jgi:hypothetical protein